MRVFSGLVRFGCNQFSGFDVSYRMCTFKWFFIYKKQHVNGTLLENRLYTITQKTPKPIFEKILYKNNSSRFYVKNKKLTLSDGWGRGGVWPKRGLILKLFSQPFLVLINLNPKYVYFV